MKKIFLSVSSLFLLIFIGANLTFAQSTTTEIKLPDGSTTTGYKILPDNNSSSSMNSDDFLKNLDVPKIINNNVRVNNIKVNKAVINDNNQLEIEGTLEIVNYSDAESSKLYMSAYTGIKGRGYYIQYPLYNYERSEAFILKPKETITKSFKVVENNFLTFGLAAVEILINDEYNRMVHKEISILPFENFIQIKQDGKIFTDLKASLSVGDKNFPAPSGPTFYPENENMILNLDFGTTTPDFVDKIDLAIFDRIFFTKPIKEFNIEANNSDSNVISFKIPEDMKPGVYPIQVSVNTNDNSYVPRIYGRFIIGGNMSKTTDVTLNASGRKIIGLTLVVQGNPPDITNSNVENNVNFDAEVTVLGKKDEILFNQKIDNQAVEIYRNIDFVFDDIISKSKIKKVKVTLSDDSGEFDTYEKEFNYETFNYLNILYILAVIIALILLVKLKKKHNLTALFIFVTFFGFAQMGSAQVTPAPDSQAGFLVYDSFDLRPSGHAQWCADDVYDYPASCADDIDIIDAPNILQTYGISVNFLQPDFTTCYPASSTIPIVVSSSYTLCNNSPLTESNCSAGNDPETGEPISCGPEDYDASSGSLTMKISSDGYWWGFLPWYDNIRQWAINRDINDEVIISYCNIFGGCTYSDPYPNRYSEVVYLEEENYVNDLLSYINTWIDQIKTISNSDSLGFQQYCEPESGDCWWYLDSNDALYTRYNEQEIGLLSYDIFNENDNNISNKPFAYVDFEMDGLNGDAYYEDTIVAPGEPGEYNYLFSVNFQAKEGNGYYVGQYKINVCNGTTTTPVFSAECTPGIGDNATTTINSNVSFTISTQDGNPNNTTYYSWDGITASTSNSYTTSYNAIGTQTFYVPVTNGTSTTQVACSVEVVDNTPPPVPNITAICEPEIDKYYAEQESVNFVVNNVSGGTSPYSYLWENPRSVGSPDNENSYTIPENYTLDIFSKNVTITDSSIPEKEKVIMCEAGIYSCGSANGGSFSDLQSNDTRLCKNSSVFQFGYVDNGDITKGWQWSCQDEYTDCSANYDSNPGDPDVNVRLKIQPKIAPSCKVSFVGNEYDLSDEEVCTLFKPDGTEVAFSTSTGNADLSTQTLSNLGNGTYTFVCENIVENREIVRSSDVCISNPTTIEQ